MSTETGRASLVQTVRTIAWSLIGIRNSSRHREGEQALRPLPLMFGALVAVILFVLALMALVHWIA